MNGNQRMIKKGPKFTLKANAEEEQTEEFSLEWIASGVDLQNRKIEIRCFCIDPSVKSSLRFLRTTPWAREKVENLYLYVLRQKAKQKS